MGIAMSGNILEACITEAKAGHIVNSIAGLLVIAGFARSYPPAATLSFGPAPDVDLQWSINGDTFQQAMWNWSYTLWNATFCLQTLGDGIRPLSHLVGPMVFFGAWEPQRWCQTRLYVLFGQLIVEGGVGAPVLKAYMPLWTHPSKKVLKVLAGLSLAANVIVTTLVWIVFPACYPRK